MGKTYKNTTFFFGLIPKLYSTKLKFVKSLFVLFAIVAIRTGERANGQTGVSIRNELCVNWGAITFFRQRRNKKTSDTLQCFFLAKNLADRKDKNKIKKNIFVEKWIEKVNRKNKTNRCYFVFSYIHIYFSSFISLCLFGQSVFFFVCMLFSIFLPILVCLSFFPLSPILSLWHFQFELNTHESFYLYFYLYFTNFSLLVFDIVIEF